MGKIIGRQIFRYSEIDSTNDEAKRLIKNKIGEGAAVIAEAQTKGRGKPGAKWFSPPGTGIYLSAIVKPFRNPDEVKSLTLAAARAVVRAIQGIAGLRAEIKPPNDVLVNGKKICGILVERDASGNIIIGIGLNVNTLAGEFPEELKERATSLAIEAGKLFETGPAAERLLAELDGEYLAYLKNIC